MSKFNALRLRKYVAARDISAHESTVDNLVSTRQGGSLSSEDLFDNLARSMAGSLSRRDVLKTAVAGLAGIALAKLGIKTAWAGANCLCNGTPYDPNLACCTPTGVVQKNPIADLTRCPGKVPTNPPHICRPNGCGGSGGIGVPDSFLAADFLPSCNNHDCCYDSCNSVKATCDTDFQTSLRTACTTAYPGAGRLDSIRREMCLSTANTYFNFVDSRGQPYYDAAQRQSCDCCGPNPCTTPCAGGACGNLPRCSANNPDCLCFTTPEGDGACIPGSTPCRGLRPCTSSADCPPGYGCAVTSCCGNFGVCGPLCSDVTPAGSAVSRSSRIASGPTMGGR
jgi:hypothetical protein